MGTEQKAACVRLVTSGEFDDLMRFKGRHPSAGSRAIGLRHIDGSEKIIIDADYYRHGGIPDDMLPAIVVHEQTELAYDGKHAEFRATQAEYEHILGTFGPDGLVTYHTRLSNLLGGQNYDIRRAIFALLTGKG